jgi:hypothetical protein
MEDLFIDIEELHAGGVAVYKGIWADPETTIQEIEDYGPVEYFASVNDAAKYNKKMETILKRYTKIMEITVPGYNAKFSVNEKLNINEEYIVLKLNEGEERQLTYGGGTSTGRTITAILYLNDDYDGGEIEFVNFDVKIKPTKGTLVLFPSHFSYAYKENEVKNGIKYSINTFIHDRPLDDLSKEESKP